MNRLFVSWQKKTTNPKQQKNPRAQATHIQMQNYENCVYVS